MDLSDMISRRELLSRAAFVAVGTGLADSSLAGHGQLFRISLAEWSLNKALFGKRMDNLDFPRVARQDFGIDGVEYVNQFFMDKAKNEKYLAELKKRSRDHGVTNVLIMCDNEGRLGDPDSARRTTAVENHYKWVDAAKYLGCHSIRVNAASAGHWDEQVKLAADGLRRLTEYGAKQRLNVIVENHGGLSSNGKWLAQVMRTVNHPRCGTLPDFGNFRVGPNEEYDRYLGTDELMPFAKGVSAKSHDFRPDGEETATDFRRMMQIVLVKHGFRGWVGVEYEGSRLSEPDGIRATKRLLERIREELTVKQAIGSGNWD